MLDSLIGIGYDSSTPKRLKKRTLSNEIIKLKEEL